MTPNKDVGTDKEREIVPVDQRRVVYQKRKRTQMRMTNLSMAQSRRVGWFCSK